MIRTPHADKGKELSRNVLELNRWVEYEVDTERLLLRSVERSGYRSDEEDGDVSPFLKSTEQLERPEAAKVRVEDDSVKRAEAKDFKRLQRARDHASPETSVDEPLAKKITQSPIIGNDKDVWSLQC